MTLYKKETTKQRLELLKKEIVDKISTKGVFPYVYDLDNTYLYPNGSIDNSMKWAPLSMQNRVILRGDFHAMIGGFLFLKQSRQTLSAIDIHKHVGKMCIRVYRKD